MFSDRDVETYWDGYFQKWWEASGGEDGNFYHQNFIHPTILRLIGDVKQLKVLDVGCGTGILARCLSEHGANVTGIDISTRMLEMAHEIEMKRQQGIKYYRGSASNMEMFKAAYFDAVICSMALMDIPDYEGAIHEAYRVLKHGGLYVIAILHPCFWTPDSGWEKIEPSSKRNEDKLYWKVDHYFERQSGRELLKFSFADGTQPPTFHRPLGDYLNGLIEHGFQIARIEESEPEKETLYGWDCSDMKRIATYLFVSAKKV